MKMSECEKCAETSLKCGCPKLIQGQWVNKEDLLHVLPLHLPFNPPRPYSSIRLAGEAKFLENMQRMKNIQDMENDHD